MKIKLLFITLFSSVLSFSQNCTDLLISEYVEGWGNNKALEIYNPTNTPINLSEYFIARYSNGSTTATVSSSVQLSGIVPAFDVFVAVLDKRDPNGEGQEAPIWDSLQARADGFFSPDFNISSAFYWNGNDAFILAKGTLPSNASALINASTVTGFQIIDVFGKIGENPANETGSSSGNDGAWSTQFPYSTGLGVLVTQDHSMIRKATVKKGVVANPSFFDPLLEYDTIPAVIVRLDANGDTIFQTNGIPIYDGNWVSLGFHDCECSDAPAPTLSVLSGSTTICTGDTANLMVNITGSLLPSGGLPIYTVTITDGLNNFTSSGFNPVTISVSPSISTTYTIVSVSTSSGNIGTGNTGSAIISVIPNSSNIIYETACDSFSLNNQVYFVSGVYNQVFQSSNGCDSIVTLNLTINENNAILIQPNPSFGNSPLNVAFANQTQNISDYNFTWYFGDGSSLQSNAPFLSHIYTQDGYSDVTVVAENLSTGCITSQMFEDIIFVIGGVTCSHTATILQNSSISACFGDSILLSCNTNPTFSYQWYRNGVPVNGAIGSSFNFYQSGSYTVVIYQNNCPVTSNSVSISFNPIPTIPIITSSGNILPCIGGSITLNTDSGFTNYIWNNGYIGNTQQVSNSGNYFVTITDSNGCQNTSLPYAVNASFLQSPEICIVGMDSLTNKNRIVWEKPILMGIDSFYVYKESNVSNVYSKIGSTNYDDLAVFIDENSNPSIQAYRYKISALDSCGTETNVGGFHKTSHLSINQGVSGSWNLIWSHYEGMQFGSYNIYRGTNPSNISLLTTIQGNLNSYTDLNPPSGSVYYQIEIVNPNSCDPTKILNYGVSKSNIVNNGIIGLEEKNGSAFKAYPNPSNDFITIEITSDQMNKKFQLIDFYGRKIIEGKISSLKQIIDLQDLKNGSYFLNLENSSILIIKI